MTLEGLATDGADGMLSRGASGGAPPAAADAWRCASALAAAAISARRRFASARAFSSSSSSATDAIFSSPLRYLMDRWSIGSGHGGRGG
eukprot:132334-Chlamydomonas_euryale.AAC.4